MAALRVAAIDRSAAASRSWSWRLDALLRFLRLCGLPLTRRVRDRLGAGAGVGERLLVGGDWQPPTAP